MTFFWLLIAAMISRKMKKETYFGLEIKHRGKKLNRNVDGVFYKSRVEGKNTQNVFCVILKVVLHPVKV